MKAKKYLLTTCLLVFIGLNMNSQEYLQMIDAGTYPVQDVSLDNAEAYFEGRGQGTGIWVINSSNVGNITHFG